MKEPKNTSEQLPEKKHQSLRSPPCPSCGRAAAREPSHGVWICHCGAMFRRTKEDPELAELVTGKQVREEREERLRSKPSLDPPIPAARLRVAKTSMKVLAIGALGVVFGDIGTSPLYAVQTIFSASNHIVTPNHAGVYGVISLIFWTITMIVSFKYIFYVMRASNEGEGGIMALLALIRQSVLKHPKTKIVLIAMGVIGAALFYGDGMITPAISVISAVEGVEVISPTLSSLVVPLTLIILVGLFAFQHRGTGTIGRFFGPVLALWFFVLALGGLSQIIAHPGIIAALSPSYGIQFMVSNFAVGFVALAGVVLVVTGAEALYADMGHFGRPAILRAWFLCAFPCLTLSYLGQGALILHDPKMISGTLFHLYPGWAQIPFILLATVATVIASQALISGAFSISRQAVQLGFLPRLRVMNTSEREEGQIYVPSVNWGLLAGISLIVVGFGSSARLASAYGVAVTGTFITTTVLFLVVLHVLWHRPLWKVIPLGIVLLTIDLFFFAANLRKVVDGGWLPLMIAIGVFTMFMTWRKGNEIVTVNRTKKEGSLHQFIEGFREMKPPVQRVPGMAVFLHANPETTPLSMRANVEHNHSLHKHVIIMSIKVLPYPHLDHDSWLMVDDSGYRDDGIIHATVRVGFKDHIDVPELVDIAAKEGLWCKVQESECTYFLSKMNIYRSEKPGLADWRKRLFVAMSRHATNPVDLFNLPVERTIIMGGRIAV